MLMCAHTPAVGACDRILSAPSDQSTKVTDAPRGPSFLGLEAYVCAEACAVGHIMALACPEFNLLMLGTAQQEVVHILALCSSCRYVSWYAWI